MWHSVVWIMADMIVGDECCSAACPGTRCALEELFEGRSMDL
jgi:hypothetical protein